MSITQTVEVPVSHRLIIDVPREVPAGPVILTFTPNMAAQQTTAQEQKKEREFGCAKGEFWMADDFDEPLEDFKDYM